MGYKKEIIKSIEKMSGRHSPYEIFSDWVEASALAIQNGCDMSRDDVWRKREEQYIAIMKKYNNDEQIEFQRMFSNLTMVLEEQVEDVLGEVYMKAGCYNKQLGQFFTPYHLSKLTAELCMPDDIDEEKEMPINEPSVGGGGMIIGTAAVLNERGINYQKIMNVTAQDLDWHGVYMSYLQFSLLGIKATVVQGDTLCDPYNKSIYPKERVFMTPKRMGVI